MKRDECLRDIPVSPLGFGLYAACGAYGTSLEEEEIISIIRNAYDLGILFYDTADKYGDTERVLGRAIKPFRNKVSISSKAGITVGMENKFNKNYIIKACEESLKRLNTEYIDVYQIHFDEFDTNICEIIEALEKLKEDGKIRYYGIGHMPMDKTMGYLRAGNISTILAEISPVAVSSYKKLHKLQQDFDFGIIGFSITGRGILSGEIGPNTRFSGQDIRSIDPLFKRSKLESAMRIMERLRKIGEDYNKTPAQISISWVLKKKGIVTALTGPCRLKHLKENCAAAECELSNDTVKEIDDFIKKEEKYLKNAVLKESQRILDTSFRRDLEEASSDLIYVMENVIENGVVSSEKIVPMYLKILELKKSGNMSMSLLEEIRQCLKGLM